MICSRSLQGLCMCMAIMLLLVPPDSIRVHSFVCVSTRNRHNNANRFFFGGYSQQNRRLLHSSSSNCNENNDDFDTFHVIASDKVILPGEQTSLSLKDEDAIPLIRHALTEDKTKQPRIRIAVAIRVISGGNSYKEEISLAQVASLCEISSIDDIKINEECNLVTIENLKCVSRIRLMDMIRQCNTDHFQFQGEWIEEENSMSQQELIKAKKIENNIERLMKQASRIEQEINMKHRRQQAESKNKIEEESLPSSLDMYKSYLKTKERIFRVVSTAYDQQSQLVRSGSSSDNSNKNQNFIVLSDNHDINTMKMTATSWAVFLCLNDANLETRYRLRALDWDNLLERIKLAQYVLREKTLFLQGQILELQQDCTSSPSLQEDYYGCNENAFQ